MSSGIQSEVRFLQEAKKESDYLSDENATLGGERSKAVSVRQLLTDVKI